MAEPPGDALERTRRNYTPAFLLHLARRDEATLRAGYEIGRDAMAAEVSLLDLVHIHHTVFAEVASTMRSVDEVADVTGAAAAFLVEALAPYEMSRRTVAPRRRAPLREGDPVPRKPRR